MSNYVSIRTKPCTMTQAYNQMKHDMRLNKPPAYLRDEPNITAKIHDARTGEVLNIDSDALKQFPRDGARAAIRDCLEKHDENQRYRKERQQIKKGNDGGRPVKNTFISGVLTFSPGGIANIAPEALDKAAENTFNKVCQELGVNPVYIARHNDEKTPHYHLMFEGTARETGQAVASRINKEMCRRLQDIAGDCFQHLGLQRGRPKAVTNANHLSVLESHRAEAEKARTELEELKAQVEAIKIELRETRKTKEERARMDADERRMLDEERRTLREQQKALREEIDRMTKEANDTAERLKKLNKENEEAEAEKTKLMNAINRMTPDIEEAQRIEANRANRRRAISTMLYRLRDAGVLLCNVAKRYTIERGNHGDWRPLSDLNLSETKNVIGYADDLLRNGGEAHIKLYGTPPVFCLDDITADNLKQIQQDFGGTLATVETSPLNYQVWIAFADKDKQQLKPAEWRAVNHYLVRRYHADPNADRAGHYYRLAGFRRVDNPDWTAQLTPTYSHISGRNILDKLIDIALPKWEQLQEKRNEIAENADIQITRTSAPEWFVNKWLRAWHRLDENDTDKELSWSEIDWATSCNILRNAPEHQRLRYAGYIADILSNAGERRGKSKEYADITAAKAYSFVEAER